MSAIPWFKFFPSDWRSDVALRSCSPLARALWIELLCLMHDGVPVGYLTVNGRPLALSALPGLTGIDADGIASGIAELDAAAIFSRTPEGVIFSRKMVRDATKSAAQAAKAKKRWGVEKKGENQSGNAKPDAHGNAEPYAGGNAESDAKTMPQKPHSTTVESKNQSSLRSDCAEAWEAILEIEAEGKRAWNASMFVLMDQGGKSDSQARKLIGAYRRDLDPADSELLEAAQAVRANGTGDPASLLRKTLQGIVERRGERPRPEAERDPFLPPIMPTDPEQLRIYRLKMTDWVKDRNDWPTSRGPQPDQPFTRHVPAEIMAEFGYGPLAHLIGPKAVSAKQPQAQEADDIGRMFE